MKKFSRPKRLPYPLQLLLLAVGFFFSTTLFSQMLPLYRSFFGEEYVFFGRPTLVAEKMWLPGRVLPLDEFPRIRFALNDDIEASFIFYPSPFALESLPYWFPLVRDSLGLFRPVDMEVHAVRIEEKKWVVTEMESSYGEASSDELFSYHWRASLSTLFWGVGLFFMAVFFLVSLLRASFFRAKVV